MWGTQLDIQAAADYYEMCIYLLTKQQRGTIGIDTQPGTVLYLQTTCHTSNFPGPVHFDPILDTATLQIPKSVPQLDGATEYLEDIL